MWTEFREFLLKQNALALAIGVIIGAAIGRVVSSLAADIIMPVISLGIPTGDWRSARFVLSETIGPDGKPVVNAINYGVFVGTILDFVIVAFVVFLIVRQFLKPAATPPTKECPFCLEVIPIAATKCRACASALP
jgi:large conductance mechanosensitive channel